jgi:hypothetical protein
MRTRAMKGTRRPIGFDPMVLQLATMAAFHVSLSDGTVLKYFVRAVVAFFFRLEILFQKESRTSFLARMN